MDRQTQAPPGTGRREFIRRTLGGVASALALGMSGPSRGQWGEQAMSRTILHNGKFTTLDPARPRARHVKAPAEPFWGAVGCSCFAF